MFDDYDDDYDYFVELQLSASSRQEAIDMTGDDTFYPGTDSQEEDYDDELETRVYDTGISIEDMPRHEAREVLEEEGFEDYEIDDILDNPVFSSSGSGTRYRSQTAQVSRPTSQPISRPNASYKSSATPTKKNETDEKKHSPLFWYIVILLAFAYLRLFLRF